MPPEAGRRSRRAREQAPNVEEALGRAATHARNSAAEGVAALRALLDAATLAAGGELPPEHSPLGILARSLDELSGLLSRGDRSGASLLEAVVDALDAEIARWEERARDDPDARAVLRAYLGVREVLWELGVRRPTPDPDGDAGGSRPPRRSGRERGARVQRVRIED